MAATAATMKTEATSKVRGINCAVALLLGVLLGVSTGIANRIFGGPTPETIASASLESMRAQNRLIAFVARYVSVGNFVFKAGAGAPKKNQREGGDRSSIPRNHPQHDDQLPTKL